MFVQRAVRYVEMQRRVPDIPFGEMQYGAIPRVSRHEVRCINVLEVRAFGSMGRVYLGGEERDIDVGWRAAVAAIEGLEGREVTK